MCLLLLPSCIKNAIDDIESLKGLKADPLLQLPFLNARVGMDKLVSDAGSGGLNIVPDPSKRLVVKFGSRDSLQDKQFVTIDPIHVNTGLGIPAPLIPFFVADGGFETTVNEKAALETNADRRVERIEVKSGVIRTSITSGFRHDVSVTVTYPGITRNGAPLVDEYHFVYKGTVDSIQHVIDIAGYDVDFTDNGTTYNTVPYQVKVKVTRNPANPVSPDDKIIVRESINLDEYKRADGYFGELEVVVFNENQLLTIFDKKIDGQVFIRDPVVRVKVENTIGMPIVGRITQMFVESGNGNRVPIIIDQFRDTFSIGYTTVTGQSRVTEYLVDRSNSNIAEVLSSAPQKISYTVVFTGNYGGQVRPNVLTDKSTMKIVSSIDLPLDLRILNYALEETGSFSMSETTKDVENDNWKVEWAEIACDAENYLPLNIFLQVYFEDSLQQPPLLIDSLFDSPIPIPAASIDPAGNVIAPGKDYMTRFIPREKYDRINKGNKYRLHIRLRTAEENGNLPFVTFYIDQQVNLRMGIKTRLNLKATL